VALDGSFVSRSSSVSLPFWSVIVAPMRSPDALKTSFSGSASILTWSLTSCASSIAWLSPWVVAFARTLKVTFGVGTSSSVASSVGIVKLLWYFPVIFSCSFAVFSSRSSSTISSLLVLLSSFSSSLMFMHIFVGSEAEYSSNMVFGHSKSIMATRDGSIARSFRLSGSILNVASSTSMLMLVIMSFRSLASATLSVNMLVSPFSIGYCLVANKRILVIVVFGVLFRLLLVVRLCLSGLFRVFVLLRLVLFL
jgi:hypothetical protein